MDSTERMRIFTRVAELASFTQAADALNLPKASVSTAVQQLESDLGTRLLHRTTRRVQLTQDGQVFYERCKDLIADVDEVQSMFQAQSAQTLRGRARVDMSTAIARNIVIPRLPELLRTYPLLEIELSSTERRVDLIREGFDCVLRTGGVGDTSLIARPIALLRMINCASPAYVARFGAPTSLADLDNHHLVHFVSTLGATSGGFEYMDAESGEDRSLPMRGAITVNSAEAYQAACVAGLGIVQIPAIGVTQAMDDGRLVHVLPDYPARAMPLTLLYANRRNLSKRVRVVMDWLATVVGEYLAGHAERVAIR